MLNLITVDTLRNDTFVNMGQLISHLRIILSLRSYNITTIVAVSSTVTANTALLLILYKMSFRF